MIPSSDGFELPNLAHYWRRIAPSSQEEQVRTGSLYSVRSKLAAVVERDQAFAEFARGRAGGESKSFGEVARAQVADLRSDLSYGEFGIGE